MNLRPDIVFLVLTGAGWAVPFVFDLVSQLQILQRNEYRISRILKLTPSKKPGRLLISVIGTSLVFLSWYFWFDAGLTAFYIPATASWLLAIAYSVWMFKPIQKLPISFFRPKPGLYKNQLVLTLKAIGILVLSFIILAAESFGVYALSRWGLKAGPPFGPIKITACIFPTLTVLSVPFYLSTAELILKPFKKLAGCILKALAQTSWKPLKDKVAVIGITGSAGKTTTKQILKNLLETKFRVWTTERSVNTEIGVAGWMLSIKKEILNELASRSPRKCAVIVEMGAYSTGEIRQLCELTDPKTGVLTTINPQHLEFFKSINQVVKAKFELVDWTASRKNGTIIVNGDNKYIRQALKKQKAGKAEVWVFGSNEKDGKKWANKRGYRWIGFDGIEFSEFGTIFNIYYKKQRTEIQTKLIGEGAVHNLCAAIAAAKSKGIKIVDSAEKIKDIEPPKHRMEIINPGTGILILDNSYSSNVEGFKFTLEYAKALKKQGKRIIFITPGITELGKKTKKTHLKLGKRLSKASDIVLLVGKSDATLGLLEGLKSEELQKSRINKVPSREEAAKWIEKNAKPNDLIIFESDR